MEIKNIAAVDIKSFFDSLTPEEIVNKDLLTEFLLKRVGIGFRERDFKIEEGEYLPNKGFKIKIWPDELARFLIFLYEHKSQINSFLEFGTGNGGSFFVIDSYLRSINPNMSRSVTIDQHRHMPSGIEDYLIANPGADCFNLTKTDKFEMDQDWDLCFIDASHKYVSVKCDYLKVKDRCKFVAFHDILTHNKRKPDQLLVRHLWKELEGNKIEIITDDPRISFMSAIGVTWND